MQARRQGVRWVRTNRPGYPTATLPCPLLLPELGQLPIILYKHSDLNTQENSVCLSKFLLYSSRGGHSNWSCTHICDHDQNGKIKE